MTYRLTDPVTIVRGIGAKLQASLSEAGIETVSDLVLYLPYRYQDRSQIVPIDQLVVGEESTIRATVKSSHTAYRGRRVTVRATVEDESGKLQCIWFNNRFVAKQLKKGEEFYFAGKFSDRKMLVQPMVEQVSDDPIHTARLVPIYSQLSADIKLGLLRRILKRTTDNLKSIADPIAKASAKKYPNFIEAIKLLHFPADIATIPAARERLALEELLGLIQHSQLMKNLWRKQHNAIAIKLENYDAENFSQWLPDSIPFELTQAQQRVIREILSDLQNDTAMNRILVGDVGSGKTVVAGIAANFVLKNQHNAVIAAPTQILAQQHSQSLKKLFPELNIQLLTSKESKTFKLADQPTFYIGTHAVLNHLTTIQPALIIYDEQHRFGVKQRSLPEKLQYTPHLLTMSATPIPRSLMLTLFSHLQLSTIDEMPAGRRPTTTWLVPKSKRSSSLTWIAEKIESTNGQALIVCPFIEPSEYENLSNIAAATDLFRELTKFYKKQAPTLTVKLLHGQLASIKKQQVIDDVFAKKVDILVTTPVVEVGVDLPAANIILIEAAERFGLASLHQLRGRVGRAGQESFCLLFTNTKSAETLQRLATFTTQHDGLKLAAQDLKNRGAGDLFGFRQHGLSDLRFASWADLELIQQAHLVFPTLNKQTWQPLISYQTDQANASPSAN